MSLYFHINFVQILLSIECNFSHLTIRSWWHWIFIGCGKWLCFKFTFIFFFYKNYYLLFVHLNISNGITRAMCMRFEYSTTNIVQSYIHLIVQLRRARTFCVTIFLLLTGLHKEVRKHCTVICALFKCYLNSHVIHLMPFFLVCKLLHVFLVEVLGALIVYFFLCNWFLLLYFLVG